ncbi:MAG: hypothetical protein IT244_12975 [Bacteroidia bacterium]|nr:hypothetical protein [Bacteroidia bacterium]
MLLKNLNACIAFSLFLFALPSSAQTDMDGIMMAKRNLCSELTYSHASWTHYWEGTFYRDNANIGKVSAQTIGFMSNYGVTDKFNVLVTVPYISTKASAGTLHGLKGLQDFALMGKYKFWNAEKNGFYMGAVGVLGITTPLSNYTPDLLPLSIGMHSTNGVGRLILDVEKKNFFTTLSYAYTTCSNVKIDRESYYTTEMHNTNIVNMPNNSRMQIRAGYRKNELLVELFADRMNTIGGFDIRKNDMPFISNNMDMSRVGANVKIPIPKTNGFGVVANTAYTVAGRNVGRTFQYMAGLFYIAEFSQKGAAK